jgi:hypothetical protein
MKGFAEVARTIAKNDPPEWLVLGLEHFSTGIGITYEKGERQGYYLEEGERLNTAIGTLLRLLPFFRDLPYGIQCPDDVAVVLDALPRIKANLIDPVLKQPSTGRPPNMQREHCAAVVVEAWLAMHGSIQPRSDRLQEACKSYWLACGGEPIGETDDIDNWRRYIENAIARDHRWVRRILGRYRTPPK